jgi:AraC-like DNA-binding protein
MTSLIKATSLTGFLQLSRDLGGSPEELLRHFNIDPQQLDNSSAVIPYTALNGILELSAEKLQCPDFALQLAQRQSMMVMGPLAFIAQNSSTVAEALQDISKYLHTYSPAILMTLDQDTNPALPRLLFELRLPSTQRQRQIIELTLAMAHKTLQMLYGNSFRAEAVFFRNSTNLPNSSYQRFFGVVPSFSQGCNALVMRAEHLNKTIDQKNAQLHDTLLDFVTNISADNPMDSASQVEQIILRLLPTQRCTLPLIAERMGMHERALQRRLAEHSMIFEDLVDRSRRALADRYLMEAHMPMAQMAGLLGYAEQSSFNRACRRWYGCSPSERRKQLALL